MISNEAIDAFNCRLVDLHKLENFGPEQRQRVKREGEKAKQLLSNPDFAQFVYQAKFELTDQLIDIQGYGPEQESRRLAIAHQVAGIQSLVDTIKKTAYWGNRAVSLEARLNKETNNE